MWIVEAQTPAGAEKGDFIGIGMERKRRKGEEGGEGEIVRRGG